MSTDERPQPVHEPGTIVGDRWELVEKLAKGGQATTWRSRDRETDRSVAVKTLILGQTADWQSVELFERSAEVLERLDHPQIPTYHDAFHVADEQSGGARYYLVREFVDGEDFETLLETEGVLEAEGARILLAEMLELLDYLHNLNPPVVHRDIKPANLISTPDHRIVLVDFGASQQAWEMTLGASRIAGTIGYAPPEQMSGTPRPASDLYALGATVIHLMTRTPPAELPADRLKLQFRDRLDAPESLCTFLETLVEPDPDDRPASAAAALDRLGSQVGQQVVDSSTPTRGNAPVDWLEPAAIDGATLLARGDDYVRFSVPSPEPRFQVLGHAPVWGTAAAVGAAFGSIPALAGAVVYLTGCALFAPDSTPFVVELSTDGLQAGRHQPTAGWTFGVKGAGWAWDADRVDDVLAGPGDRSDEAPTHLSQRLAPVVPTHSLQTFLTYLATHEIDRQWLAAEWARIQEW